MMPQPEKKPPQAGKREGDEERPSIVRDVLVDRPASPATDPIPIAHTLVARRSHDRPATSARRGPLGFSYREALRIVRPVAEIEDADRSLFDSQCEPPDEGGGRR